MLKLRNLPLTKAFYLTIFWIFISLLVFLRAFSAGFTHDEYQFVASGQEFARNFLLPYRDYPFLHMPYMPFVNGVLFYFTGGTLLSARLLNEIFYLVSTLILFLLIWRSFKPGHKSWAGIVAGSVGVGLLIFDPTLMEMDGKALNHALPTLLGLLAYATYLKMGPTKRLGGIIFSGLAIGLATGVRLSYAVMVFPFLAVLVLFPQGVPFKNRIKNGLVFGFSVLGGLLPAIFLFLAAPQRAYYGNLLYIRLNTIYRDQMGSLYVMSLSQKIQFFYETVLKTPVGFIVYLLFASTIMVVAWGMARRRQPARPEIVLSAGLALVLLAAGFAPTPVWPQYFFAPIPFVLLTIFSGLQGLDHSPRLAGLVLLIVVLILAAAKPLASSLEMLNNPQDWTTTRAASQASDLRAIVPSGRVLTLASIVPLEAGLDIYPVFIVGPFSWRTAPILSAKNRILFGVIGPDELEGYLSQDAPTAILTGPEKNYEGFTADDKLGLEGPFIQYAKVHGYQPQVFNCRLFSECTLWLK